MNVKKAWFDSKIEFRKGDKIKILKGRYDGDNIRASIIENVTSESKHKSHLDGALMTQPFYEFDQPVEGIIKSSETKGNNETHFTFETKPFIQKSKIKKLSESSKDIWERAEAMYSKAETHLKAARESLKNYDSPAGIKNAQEAFEFFIKSIFLYSGYSYEKEHDVGKYLLSIEKDSGLSKEIVARIRVRSKTLDQWRNLAKYEDEELGIPSNKLFIEEEAKLAIKYAEDLAVDVYSVRYNAINILKPYG